MCSCLVAVVSLRSVLTLRVFDYVSFLWLESSLTSWAAPRSCHSGLHAQVSLQQFVVLQKNHFAPPIPLPANQCMQQSAPSMWSAAGGVFSPRCLVLLTACTVATAFLLVSVSHVCCRWCCFKYKGCRSASGHPLFRTPSVVRAFPCSTLRWCKRSFCSDAEVLLHRVVQA